MSTAQAQPLVNLAAALPQLQGRKLLQELVSSCWKPISRWLPCHLL